MFVAVEILVVQYLVILDVLLTVIEMLVVYSEKLVIVRECELILVVVEVFGNDNIDSEYSLKYLRIIELLNEDDETLILPIEEVIEVK